MTVEPGQVVVSFADTEGNICHYKVKADTVELSYEMLCRCHKEYRCPDEQYFIDHSNYHRDIIIRLVDIQEDEVQR